jgi:hypothetical protein
LNVCKSCKAPVRWAETDSGKSMPVDAEPNTRGNIVLLERGTEPPRATFPDAGELGRRRVEGEPVWISHFATCPNAGGHRRR